MMRVGTFFTEVRNAAMGRGRLVPAIVLLSALVAFGAAPCAANAAIALRGAATEGTATTATSLTINKPDGVVLGDVMIVTLAIDGTATVPVQAGWTLIDGKPFGGNQLRSGAVLYRVAEGTEDAHFTFKTGDVGINGSSGAIVAFSGVDSSTPLDVSPLSSVVASPAVTTVTANSVTTVTDGAAIVMLGMTGGGESWSGWSTTSPGALTELFDVQETVNNGNGGSSVGGAWSLQTTDGPTGQGHATVTPQKRNAGLLVALRPAPKIIQPVWRFRNLSMLGGYLWTCDPSERASMMANLSGTWLLEGVAFSINQDNPLNDDQLWRFRSTRAWTYLYTADPAEKQNIIDNLGSEWVYEGPAWKVAGQHTPAGTPVWRFRGLKSPTYLWTSDPNEKLTIETTLQADYQLEGIAYYLDD